MNKIVWLNKDWMESLIFCPSQLYKKFSYKNIDYTCYLRWRWSDPWTFELMDGNQEKFINSDKQCLFLLNNLFFRHNEYKKAEKVAEKLVELKIEDLLK